MGFVGWIVLGLVAGAIAKAIMNRDAGGWFATLVLGVVGAVVGGWLGSAIFDVDLGGFWDLRTWVLAILGAVLVLFVHGLVTGRRRT